MNDTVKTILVSMYGELVTNNLEFDPATKAVAYMAAHPVTEELVTELDMIATKGDDEIDRVARADADEPYPMVDAYLDQAFKEWDGAGA